MKIVKILKTWAFIKTRIILLSLILAIPSLTSSADKPKEIHPLLLALKNFDFDQFESNFGEVKIVSLGEERNEIKPIKSTTSKGTIEKKNQPELKTEKSTTLVKEKEVILAQSWGKKSTSSSSPTSSTSSSTTSRTSSSNTLSYSQPSTSQLTTPLAPHTEAIGTANSPYGFHSYRLSYMQSDRTLALLKALGYATVEYSVGRGESINESIFSTFQQSNKYPIVVKILDAAKTSLMQPAMDGGRNTSGADRLSGTYLHQSTTGAPEQRLLIIYEKKNPEQLNGILNLLHTEIDVPASQIVIEALVVEINSNKAKELGLKYNLNNKRTNFSMSDGKLSSTFNSSQRDKFGWNADRHVSHYSSTYNGTTTNYPTLGAFERIVPLGFEATLDAFISDGTAEVLTNPTILVLDGRQAMIRIGTQIPNETIQTTAYGTQKSVRYIDTGIVLNVRPRISEDGAEVTMQTETIVSSAIYDASEASLKPEDRSPPSIESKTVQSFVRVADNTPFIIGGLIDKKKSEGETGIPVLSKLPIIGNLFKSKANSATDREVIIVLTPHIIDSKEKSFSYVIPKDSETFDSFNNVLFRNAYRIRDDDLFDLSFATQSEYFKNILAELKDYKSRHPEIADDSPLFSYLGQKVPGEEVIVRRMIWEIVHKAKYHEYIADDHILLFEEHNEAEYGNKFKTHLLNLLMSRLTDKAENSLILNFADHKARSKGPFEHPRANISLGQVSDPANYVEQMSKLNARDSNRHTLLLCPDIPPPGVRGANALEVLKGVLVLKRILALNSSMPVTINEFRVGRQIIFPTEQELKDKYHVVDYDAVRFFYDIINYYPEFENAFNQESQAILQEIQPAQK
jgi:type II secretory pathway component GspD/PulD (secretin)